jgi:hypothetical protein
MRNHSWNASQIQHCVTNHWPFLEDWAVDEIVLQRGKFECLSQNSTEINNDVPYSHQPLSIKFKQKNGEKQWAGVQSLRQSLQLDGSASPFRKAIPSVNSPVNVWMEIETASKYSVQTQPTNTRHRQLEGQMRPLNLCRPRNRDGEICPVRLGRWNRDCSAGTVWLRQLD